MIIPENWTPGSPGIFKSPKDRDYLPFTDYCWGSATAADLFTKPASRGFIWTLSLSNVGVLTLTGPGNKVYQLGTFTGNTKVSFCFDKDMFPIVAFNGPRGDGNTAMGVRVVKFIGEALPSGAPQLQELKWVPAARSPGLSITYDWDPGSINNQPLLVYINSASQKLVTATYGDLFATPKELANIPILETDYIHRVGFTQYEQLQIEYARITI